MKKITFLLTSLASILSPIVVAISCAKEAKEKPPAFVASTLDVGKSPNKKQQVFAVSDAGDFNDGSFNQQTGDAVESFLSDTSGNNKKKPNSASPSDIAVVMNSLIKDGAKVIAASGFLHRPALRIVTPKNPGVGFIFVDGELKAKKEGQKELVQQGNVLSWVYKMEQPSFLGGYRAAEYASKHKGKGNSAKVATFGGMNIPSVVSFMEGFKKGVAYWNEKNEKNKVEMYDDQSPFIGNFDSNKDSAVSKKTETLIKKGVDVILPVGGPQAITVLNSIAAQAKSDSQVDNVRIIGVDTKLSENKKSDADKKKYILGSIVKEIKQSIISSLEAIYGKKLPLFDNKTGKDILGKVKEGTLKNSLDSYWKFDGKNPATKESDKTLIDKAEQVKLT